MNRYNASLYELLELLKLQHQRDDIAQIEVLNPDIFDNSYSGEIHIIEGQEYIYRAYNSYVDLAQLLFSKMLTPKISSRYTVTLSFKKLQEERSFHHDMQDEKNEKYGIDSDFFKINKLEEPSFLNAYYFALKNVNIEQRQKVLNLGVNKADEFELIKNMLSPKQFSQLTLTGVDYSKTAIEYAKNRFDDDNIDFFIHDINKLDTLKLPPQNLIISIGTFQSPNINFKPFFQNLVQNYLARESAIILGFPNCRWIDGTMIYGAKAPNYPYSEMSLLYNDVVWCKKYLQQKKFRVRITGKDYIFLTATKIL